MTLRVRRLDPSDAAATQRLLDADLLRNVYLRSELRLGALRSGLWWGAFDGDAALQAVMVAGPLVVPWVPTADGAAALAGQLSRQAPPRMIVGPRDQAAALQAARRPAPPPREVRDPQPLLVVGRGGLRAEGSERVRRGTRGDLDVLVRASAAMHREEMGVDPLLLDPAGWRHRMTTLVDRGWSWVWMEDGDIIFKAELSARTPEVAMVQGVWTAPSHRGRRVGTAGMAAAAAAVLAEVPQCSLYVNHFNTIARRLYDRLGFQQAGELATYFF